MALSAATSNRGGGLVRIVIGLVAGLAIGLAATAVLASQRPASAAAAPSHAAGAVGAVGEIYQLQAAFHRAKTTQDLDLMMSLWAPDARLVNQGDPKSPYVGTAALREYWAATGSFKNRRFSLVPSFKTQIRVDGDHGYLYFECHDVADYDSASRAIVNDTFLAGTVRRVGGHWLFADMTAGKAPTLSSTTVYFP